MEQWQHLQQSGPHLPSLLVKASFSKHGYSIRLTDLSRIWAEELDKSEIITRARARNCSIDPGEDTEQYDIFTQKLQSALQQHGKTHLALSTTKDGNLKLHLEAPLPSPLPAFEWEVDLKQMSDRSVEVDLVSPLLQKAYLLDHHMQLLIAEVQAKDKVIAKITDRLETSGHDLSAVFPGVANARLTGNKSKQEQFARHVRGLGKFDEDSWAAKLVADKVALLTTKESADAILASLSSVAEGAAGKETHVNWWQTLPNGRHIELTEVGAGGIDTTQSREKEQEQNFNGRENSNAGDDNGDFQRQATPPHLRTHPKQPTPSGNVDMEEANEGPADDEDSTEDEDDLDGPPLKSKSEGHQVQNNDTHAHVAAGAKSSSPQPATRSTAHASIARGPFTHEEDTEDDDDDLDRPSQPSQKATSSSQLPSREKSQTPQPSLSPAPSPRKRIGTFGGRTRTKSPARSVTPTEEHEDSTPASPSPERPKPKGKLGTIGGKREMKSSRASTASGTPERQHEEPASVRKPDMKAEPVEPEDPVERANAKRDALKRQLEEKAKAPVKKKRKF